MANKAPARERTHKSKRTVAGLALGASRAEQRPSAPSAARAPALASPNSGTARPGRLSGGAPRKGPAALSGARTVSSQRLRSSVAGAIHPQVVGSAGRSPDVKRASGERETRKMSRRDERVGAARSEREGAMNRSSQAAVSEPISEAVDLIEATEAELPTDAALSALEEERVEAESQRFESKAAGDTMLSRYFRDMATHRVLRPDEEVEAAKKVEALERAYWVALLAYPPAFETVATVTEGWVTGHEQTMPEELAELRKLVPSFFGSARAESRAAGTPRFTKKMQERWDELSFALACRLRELDGDRLYVEGAYEAVLRLSGRHMIERDLIGGEVQITPAFKRYLRGLEKARSAQKQAKNRFVAANLRLVVSIARRYNRGRMPLIDLIQEGNLGLMKAVERFDHARGYRFSTYASWWIRHAISRALADKGRAVRIPVHMLDTFNRVQKATQALSSRNGHDPSTEELSKETGIAPDKLEKMQGYWTETPFSLDRPVNDEDGRKFVDFLENENIPSPHEKLVQQAWTDEVHRLLSTLSPMEARILRWRFGLDDEEELTLKEIGDKYNLSRERIRQLQEQALGKIRRQLRD
jgi:RNA polymerase primary sigma factor